MTRRVATIFGGASFLGRAIAQGFAAQGYDVRVPVYDSVRDATLRLLSSVGKVAPVATSFRSDSSLYAACKNANVVVNALGIFHEHKKRTFQETHVELAARIARLAKSANVYSLVHVSTLGAALNSRSPYLRSKALGEEATLAFFKEAVILRPAPLLGRGLEGTERLSFWARFCPVIPLVDEKTAEFFPLRVEDVAATAIKGAKRREMRGHVHTLQGTCGYSLEAFVRLPVQAIGEAPRFFRLSPWFAEIAARAPFPFPGKELIRDQLHLLQTRQEEHAGSSMK